MRFGKPIKNKKRIDPRYFLSEAREGESMEEAKEYITKRMEYLTEKTQLFVEFLEKDWRNFQQSDLEGIAANYVRSYKDDFSRVGGNMTGTIFKMANALKTLLKSGVPLNQLNPKISESQAKHEVEEVIQRLLGQAGDVHSKKGGGFINLLSKFHEDFKEAFYNNRSVNQHGNAVGGASFL